VGRLALVLAGVLALDQLSKRIVDSTIPTGEERSLVPGIKLVHAINHGIAFSVSAGGPGTLIAIVAAAVIAILVFFARHARRALVWLPTGLLLGGALGNLFDRLRDGAVTDFIKLPLWPAFNLADVAITFGVLSLLYVMDNRGD